MPGPLYHNGPGGVVLRRCSPACHVVLLPRFDAEATLAAIETHGPTSSTWCRR